MPNLPNNTKLALKKLAKLLDIPTDKAWEKKLAKALNFSTGQVYGWVRHDKIAKKGLVEIEKKGYPREKWYIEPQPYAQTPEIIGTPPIDSQRNPAGPSWSIHPDALENRQVTWVHLPIRAQHKNIVEQILWILESGEMDTVTALELNVAQFSDKIKEKISARNIRRRLDQMEEEKMLFQKKIGDIEVRLNQMSFEVKRQQKEKERLQEQLEVIGKKKAKQ